MFLASPPIHLVQLFFSLPIHQVVSATTYESQVVARGVAWKSSTTSPGERYVMMAGPCKAPLWSAGCWDTALPSPPSLRQQVSPQQPPRLGCKAGAAQPTWHRRYHTPCKQWESKEDGFKGTSLSPWDKIAACQVLPEPCPKAGFPVCQPCNPTHARSPWGSLKEKCMLPFPLYISDCFLLFVVLICLNSSSKGTGQIWLDDVNCRGNEDSIYDCTKSSWGTHNCSHNEDAGVECI